jgi:hypothetical protein
MDLGALGASCQSQKLQDDALVSFRQFPKLRAISVVSKPFCPANQGAYGAISLRPSVFDVSRPVSILLIRAHKLWASDAGSESS